MSTLTLETGPGVSLLLAPFSSNTRKLTSYHQAFCAAFMFGGSYTQHTLTSPQKKVQYQHYNSSGRVRKLLDFILGKVQQPHSAGESSRLQGGRLGTEQKLPHWRCNLGSLFSLLTSLGLGFLIYKTE